MRINGNDIKNRIKGELQKKVASLESVPHLAIVVVGDNPVIQSFVNLKMKFATDIGIEIIIKKFPETVSLEEIKNEIDPLSSDKRIGGIVVQLPLPAHLDTGIVLDLIPESKDVDVLSRRAVQSFNDGHSFVLPPVVDAIREICKLENVEIKGRNVLVVGGGRLVGEPASIWFRQQGGEVTIIDKPIRELGEFTIQADIIVSGTGVQNLILPTMIKSGAVLLDAGTSESEGVIAGDIDPQCEDISSLFTPVPGGIGPITVAIIFKNLLILSEAK